MATDCYTLYKTTYRQALADGLTDAAAVGAASQAQKSCLDAQDRKTAEGAYPRRGRKGAQGFMTEDRHDRPEDGSSTAPIDRGLQTPPPAPLLKYYAQLTNDGNEDFYAFVYAAKDVDELLAVWRARSEALQQELNDCERENEEFTQVLQNFEVSDEAKMARINELEAQVIALTAERDRLKAQLGETKHVDTRVDVERLLEGQDLPRHASELAAVVAQRDALHQRVMALEAAMNPQDIGDVTNTSLRLERCADALAPMLDPTGT